MNPKKFALFVGIVMLVMGVISLIPNLVGPVDGLPTLNLNLSYGAFLNLFPMNIVNKVLLIAFGIGGIAVANLSSTALPRSIMYSRVVFFSMGLATLLGLFPQTNTFFGYWPLFGYEALAHGVFAVFGLYFGFALSQKVQTRIKEDPKLRATFQVTR